jgi:hypothetical protein
MKLEDVRWNHAGGVTIVIASVKSGRRYCITFESIVGLRILNELDIASFWLGASREVIAGSCLFEVSEGGWLALEKTRDDFYTKHEGESPAEFLIAGYQECVGVLSHARPIITEVGAEA